MASGFLVLSDGRCFAPRWAIYDAVLRTVAQQLQRPEAADAFRDWLLSLLPGPDDEKDLGYGPWLRIADQQSVERFLDLRELTPENQLLFHQAARQAANEAQTSGSAVHSDWLIRALMELADLVARADSGEPPLRRSHWRKVIPSAERQIGPGWDPEM